MQILRKPLSILLAIIMIISVFSIIPVSAVEVKDLSDTGANPYQIAIGKVSVTDANYRDILGDGTASYDPGTNTITLKNPNLTQPYFDTEGIIYINRKDNVTIKGSFNMTKAVCPYGISTVGSLTLNGSFTFLGTKAGVVTNRSLYINGGSLTAIGTTDSKSMGISVGEGYDFVIKDGVTKVRAKGNDTSILSDDITMNHNRITSPSGAFFKSYFSTPVLEDFSDVARDVTIEPSNITEYDLWVGYRRVTSANKDDVYGDGKVRFDPSANTLTLNNPTIPGGNTPAQNDNYFKIYADFDLTIKGSYTMPQSETFDEKDALYGGVRTSGSLTLDGDFTFYGDQLSVVAVGDINIASGSLTVAGSKVSGVTSAEGNINIASGVKVDAASENAPLSAKGFIIGKNMQITSPDNVKGLCQDSTTGFQFFIDNDDEVVKHIVIEYVEPTVVTDYSVWVGDTRINSQNCSDIFGDGKASYDDVTKVLTLHDPTIPGVFAAGSENIKITAGTYLTIVGSYHMDSSDGVTCGVYSTGTVTLDGDFTFLATKNAVNCAADLKVNSGSLTAKGGATAALMADADFSVADGVTKVDIEGGMVPVLANTITLGENEKITTPVNGGVTYVSNVKKYTITSGSTIVKRAVIEYQEPVVPPTEAPTQPPTQPPTEASTHPSLDDPTQAPTEPPTQAPTQAPTQSYTEPPAGTTYNIWLGSTQVTAANRNNILGDGKAQFDPNTNTLTLNDPDISGESEYESAKIYTEITITIKGSYHMTSAQTLYGIYSKNCDLTLSGDFTFMGDSEGIHASHYLKIESGSVKVFSKYTYGIFSWWEMTIGEDAERVELEGGAYAYHGNEILIEGNHEVTLPEGGYIEYEDIYDADGHMATHAVIEKVQVIDLEGSGTADAPYLIKSSEDWDKFTSFVTDGGNTSGKHFKLMNDITVSTATKTKAFSGVFDGDGHTLTLDKLSSAPFDSISGATIKNLKTAGKVSGARHISGLVGSPSGTDENLIENCVVAADIATGDTYCGGFVGHGGSAAKTTLKNCVFSGTFSKGSTIGTFWGWSDAGSTPVLENCFDISSTDHPIGRGAPSGTVINCYYTNESKQTGGSRPWHNIGKRAYTVSGAELSGSVGLKYNGTIYAGEGDAVSLTAPSADKLYRASEGSLRQNGGSLTLTMPAANVTISESSAASYTNYSNISANSGFNNERAENLFDGKTDTKWCGNTDSGNPFVLFRTDTKFIPEGYILATANDTQENPGRNPISWTLEGSTDGKSWVTITDETDNRTLEAVNEKYYTFLLTKPTTDAYPFFRFTIKKLSDGNVFQLSELQLIGTDTGEESPEGPELYEEYGLWLGTTRVNSLNKNDILNDGGKAKFDPKTNTLTLDNPIIEGQYIGGKIYCSIDLTIKGTYHMPTDNVSQYYGINSDSSVGGNHRLSLEGDFTLIGTGGGIAGAAPTCINSGSVTFIGNNFLALHSRGGLSISDDITRVEMIANGNRNALYNSWLTLGSHLLIKTPENCIVKDNNFYEADGTTVAKHIIIESMPRHNVSFEMNGHGDSIDPQSVFDGEKAVKPDDPSAEGCIFGGWFSDKACTKAYDFDAAVTGSFTLYAKWTLKEYTVNVVADNGTDAQYVEAKKIKYGEEYTLPRCIFAAPEDKAFKCWDKGNTGEKIIINSDTVITAVWRDTYKLGDVDGDGTVTILDATYIQRKLANIALDFEFIDEVADADQDGSVTILDAAYIQRWLAGLPSNQNIGKQY